MCGIVGWFKTKGADHSINSKLRSCFEDMMYMDALRGFHSVGVMTGHRGARAGDAWTHTWVKQAASVQTFIKDDKYDKAVTRAYDWAWGVAHNRWATVGAVNNDNAHPFQHGDITLVQNGTISRYADLPGVIGHPEVDTKALTQSFDRNEKGFVDTLAHVEGVDGAYALVWYNAEDRTLNFIRNSKRPLWFVECKGITFFGSELFMVLAAVTRNGYKYEKFSELPPHTHVCVSYDENVLDYACDIQINKLEIKQIKKEVARSNYGMDYYGGGSRRSDLFDDDVPFRNRNTAVGDPVYVSKDSYLRSLLIKETGEDEFDLIDQFAKQQKKTLAEAYTDWGMDAEYARCILQANAIYRAATAIQSSEITKREKEMEDAAAARKRNSEQSADDAFNSIRLPIAGYSKMLEWAKANNVSDEKVREYAQWYDNHGLRIWTKEDFPSIAALRVCFARGMMTAEEYRALYDKVETLTVKRDNVVPINKSNQGPINDHDGLKIGNTICFIADSYVRRSGVAGENPRYGAEVTGYMIIPELSDVQIIFATSEEKAKAFVNSSKLQTARVTGRSLVFDINLKRDRIKSVFVQDVCDSQVMRPAGNSLVVVE